ncbi:MAG: hypothetical protein EXR69_00625 [Myxococcales bacterium]|nr:hypothetical protein [Myxococcales bacterium]
MIRDASKRLEQETDVGRVADSVIAARLGISRKTVLAWRKRMGIRAFDNPTPTREAPNAAAALSPSSFAPETARKAKASRLDAYFDVLGTVPDRTVAEQAGVSPENVRMYRHRRGIEAQWRAGEGPPTRVELALTAVEAELGRVADTVIAQRVGVSRSAVTQYRAKKGIPAGRGDGPSASPEVPTIAALGFEVRLATVHGEETVTVLAPTATAAVVAATRLGEVIQLRRIGRVV